MYKESYVNLIVFTTKKTQDNFSKKKTVLFNYYLLPLRATLVITDTKVRGSSKAKRTLSFLGLEVLRSPIAFQTGRNSVKALFSL